MVIFIQIKKFRLGEENELVVRGSDDGEVFVEAPLKDLPADVEEIFRQILWRRRKKARVRKIGDWLLGCTLLVLSSKVETEVDFLKSFNYTGAEVWIFRWNRSERFVMKDRLHDLFIPDVGGDEESFLASSDLGRRLDCVQKDFQTFPDIII